jgi:hypothetical protein
MARKKRIGELSYEQVIEKNPLIGKVIGKNSWDYVSGSNKFTVGFLKDLWVENIKENVKSRLWKKHRGVARDCIGMGLNKAVVAVGAGQSFNKNSHILKQVADLDGVRDWDDRNFIIIASNHQYKPLLRMGIIPDFVIAVDGSDVIYDQLCTDVPEIGRNTVFLAGLQCSNKVLKEWDKQGRAIRFFLPATQGLSEIFEKASGKKAAPHRIITGGNVLNTAWIIGQYWLNSSVYIALGNDLSYPLREDADEQRKLYYADGDYSTNAPDTGTGRDEASEHLAWMGFKIEKSPIYTTRVEDRYKIEIEPVGTTQTLWVYKTWIEGQVAVNMRVPKSYHYFNCSEGGILGVLCKDDTKEGRMKEENWFMMDEVCPRFHTTMFEDAINKFIMAKEMYQCPTGVQGVTDSVKIV